MAALHNSEIQAITDFIQVKWVKKEHMSNLPSHWFQQYIIFNAFQDEIKYKTNETTDKGLKTHTV